MEKQEIIKYFKDKKTDSFFESVIYSYFNINGAGEQNRTAVSTLARSCSTIELHLQKRNGGPYGTRTRGLLRDREAR